MKRYEIRDKEQHKGWISRNPYCKYTYTYRVYMSEASDFAYKGYDSLKEAKLEGWIIPKSIKRKLVAPIAAAHIGIAVGLLAIAAVVLGLIAGAVVLVCCSWDYHTGQDTGYISAVDKMMFSDDRNIYIRRRPLDAQGFTTAEEDETAYCTTADRQEVIDRAYEAMANGKRVILVYDTPKSFGWRAIGHCNATPITEIRYAED